MIRTIAQSVLFSFLILCAHVQVVLAADVPIVAAASDLQYALDEVVAQFSKTGEGAIKLAFGSSGNFVHQIRQGAPFELFFSADEAYVDELAQRGLTLDRGVLYAVGRLALFVPNGSAVKADAELNDLAAAVADGRLRKLAIANPEHAPYGRAARAVLMHKGLWDKVQSKLVIGENISQAAQFAASGSVQAGLIAYSLAVAAPMSKAGSYAVLPAAWHEPLRQRMVLLKGAGTAARRFYTFVQTPQARAIFQKYGFSLSTGDR